jgi:hypothetical protein
MARSLIFTVAVTKLIAPWVREGASAAEIAQRIGCTVGSLRVRCSQLGISLKCPDRRSPNFNQALVRTPVQRPSIPITQPQAQGTIQVTMSQALIDQFRRSAGLRGLSSAALAKALVEVVIQDNLYDAILDEGSVPQHLTVVVKEN